MNRWLAEPSVDRDWFRRSSAPCVGNRTCCLLSRARPIRPKGTVGIPLCSAGFGAGTRCRSTVSGPSPAMSVFARTRSRSSSDVRKTDAVAHVRVMRGSLPRGLHRGNGGRRRPTPDGHVTNILRWRDAVLAAPSPEDLPDVPDARPRDPVRSAGLDRPPARLRGAPARLTHIDERQGGDVIPVLVILVIWIALLALLLGMLHIGTATPTPRPAPHRFLTSNTIDLDGDRRQAA